MVRIDAVYEGELHSRLTHAGSGAVIETDAPLDNEGRGEAFSPTDLVAAALASCTLTAMGIVARRRDWDMKGARARVEKHMVTQPERRIGRLVVEIEMPAGIPEEGRVILERSAHTCPVDRSLRPELEVDLRFDWAD